MMCLDGATFALPSFGRASVELLLLLVRQYNQESLVNGEMVGCGRVGTLD